MKRIRTFPGLALLAAATVSAQEPSTPAPADTSVAGAAAAFEFVEHLDPWAQLSLDRTFALRALTAIARVSVARRFGTTGAQAELELYPRFRGGYAYLAAAGASSPRVFVPFRTAAEVYAYPGRGMELSLGARHLHTRSEDIIAATGTIARYTGPLWISLRPTFTFADAGTGRGASLTLRRYGAGRYDYHGFMLGALQGANPESADPTRTERAPRLESFTGRYEHKRPLRRGRTRLAYALGVEREEFATGRRRWRGTLSFGVELVLH